MKFCSNLRKSVFEVHVPNRLAHSPELPLTKAALRFAQDSALHLDQEKPRAFREKR